MFTDYTQLNNMLDWKVHSWYRRAIQGFCKVLPFWKIGWCVIWFYKL